MKKLSRVLAIVLVLAMVLPGLAQAATLFAADDVRIAGDNRWETSVEASKDAYDSAETVVIVNGREYADALTGTVLAHAEKAPLLLVDKKNDAIPTVVEKEIKRLGATKAIIVGGEVAVSKKMAEALEKIVDTVERVKGDTRYETAVEVAKAAKVSKDLAFLVKGDGFADALAVGPVAAVKNAPIFLTKTDKLNPATEEALKDYDEVVVVGGVEAVSKAVYEAAGADERVSGDNRYATALAVAKKYFKEPSLAYVANGKEFPDALVGGYLGAKNNAPVLLVKADKVEKDVKEYATDKAVKVLGGKKAVSDKVVDEIVGEELKVVSVAAINSKTLEVKFNKALGDVEPANFDVYEKGNEFAVLAIEEVKVNGSVATVKLADAFEEDEKYVVEVSNVPAKDGKVLKAYKEEFSYVETVAASIMFAKTTVQASTDDKENFVKVVIKDAAGKDITANYDLDKDLEVESSDTSVVDEDLKAGKVEKDHAIVNVKIKDTKIETGNTIINVKSSLQVLTSIGKWTLDSDIDKSVTSLSEDDVATIQAQALDQDGDEITEAVITFRSTTPKVASVTEDGAIQPFAKGNATIVITAELGNKKVSKSVTITVKEEAKATSIKVDKSSVKLVIGSEIKEELKVEILDQYGKVYKDATDKVVTVKPSKEDVITGASNLTLGDDGKGTLTLDVAEGAKKGSLTLTLEYKKLSKKVTVSLVDKGDFAGYLYEVSDTTLDLYAAVAGYDKDLAKGPEDATVKVYEKDKSGNKIAEVDVFKLEEIDKDQKVIDTTDLTAAGGSLTVKPKTDGKLGKAKFAVKVGTAKVGEVTFTVVDSTPKALKTVKQVKSTISVKDNLNDALFGTDPKGGAFVGYDQYGDKVQIELEGVEAAFTSNEDVVSYTKAGGFVAVAKGTATITLKIADEIFAITVKVTD